MCMLELSASGTFKWQLKGLTFVFILGREYIVLSAKFFSGMSGGFYLQL